MGVLGVLGGGGATWPGCLVPVPPSPPRPHLPQAAALIFLILTALLCLAGTFLPRQMWRREVAQKHREVPGSPVVTGSGDSLGWCVPPPVLPRYDGCAASHPSFVS